MVTIRLQLRIMIAALRMSGVRGLMALISVGLAIAAIMIALGLSRGAESKLKSISDEMDKSTLLIKAGQVQSITGRQGWFTSTNLRNSDLDLLRANITDADAIVPISEGSLKVRFGRFDHTTNVRGVQPSYFELRNLELENGRFIDTEDDNAAARVAIVGAFVAHKLNNDNNMLGLEILIAGVPFTVIGQLSRRGLSSTGGNEDDQILIPVNTALHRVFNVNFYTSFLIYVHDYGKLDAVRSRVKESLRDSHRLAIGSRDDFEILSIAKANEIRRQNGSFLKGISQLFAVITLVIGGCGVFAVTLLNVKDRTAEIGLRMALGAKRRQIAGLFLMEACFLSVLGGIFGSLLGGIGLYLLKWFTEWEITFHSIDVAGAFAISALLGMVTGVFPALTAARLMPVVALRSA